MRYFIHGMASLIDITSYAMEFKNKLEECYIKNDKEALKSDWKIIGDDIRSGINEFKKANAKK